MSYIHENPDRPNLKWDEARLSPLLADVRHRQGRLLGKMEGLGFRLRTEVNLTTLTADIIKSSAIEGKQLDAEQVRPSIARRLGLDVERTVPSSRDVDGVVEMMLDATQKNAEPLEQPNASTACRRRSKRSGSSITTAASASRESGGHQGSAARKEHRKTGPGGNFRAAPKRC